jgi:hypothetical protein
MARARLSGDPDDDHLELASGCAGAGTVEAAITFIPELMRWKDIPALDRVVFRDRFGKENEKDFST